MNSYNGFTPAQRMKAYRWAKEQYDRGVRPRATECECCGQTEGVLDRHSEDYSEPFGRDIGRFSLCYRCHMMIHCRFKNKAAWEDYKRVIRAGYRFPAFHTRNFRKFASEMLDRSVKVPLKKFEPRENDRLEEIVNSYQP